MYKFLVLLHIITSSLFLAVAIATTVRSIAGWSKNLSYSNTDKYLRTFFMVLLYLTLIHGIIMYFFIDPSAKSAVDAQHELQRVSLRFWVVEHFYFMTFALIGPYRRSGQALRFDERASRRVQIIDGGNSFIEIASKHARAEEIRDLRQQFRIELVPGHVER